MPNDIVPAAASGLPTSRRALLAGLAATPFAAAAGAGSLASVEAHPDAAVLSLGIELDAAYAAYFAFRPEEAAAEGASWAAWEAVMAKSMLMREVADRPAEALFDLPPPMTLAGVAVLARALAGFHCGLWDDPISDMDDIGERMLRLTLDAVLALAGVDRLGRRVEGDR